MNCCLTLGHLSSDSGFAYIVDNDNVIESDTYRTLIIPSYCEVSWGPPGDDLATAVLAGLSPDDGYVVKGNIGGLQSYCGTYQPGTITKLPTPRQPAHSRSLNVLYSKYPKLEVSLKNVQYDTSHITESLTKSEVFGLEKIDVGPNIRVAPHININHSKRFIETFSFLEDDLEWVGIDRLNIETPMPFGVSEIQKTVKVKEKDKTISLTSSETYATSGFVRVEKDADDIVVVYQVCSVAQMIENVDIPFQAELIFESSRVPGTHIQKMLAEWGRPIGQIDEEDKVVVPISGVLRGRFLFNTALYIQEIDWATNPVICSQYK